MFEKKTGIICRNQGRQLAYQKSGLAQLRVTWNHMPDTHWGKAHKLHGFYTLFLSSYLVNHFHTNQHEASPPLKEVKKGLNTEMLQTQIIYYYSTRINQWQFRFIIIYSDDTPSCVNNVLLSTFTIFLTSSPMQNTTGQHNIITISIML